VRFRFERSEAVVVRHAAGIGIRLATEEPGTLFFLKETADAYYRD
jgi:hypothetical protein